MRAVGQVTSVALDRLEKDPHVQTVSVSVSAMVDVSDGYTSVSRACCITYPCRVENAPKVGAYVDLMVEDR